LGADFNPGNKEEMIEKTTRRRVFEMERKKI